MASYTKGKVKKYKVLGKKVKVKVNLSLSTPWIRWSRPTFPYILMLVRKLAKSDYYLLHVHLYVRMEQLDSHWTDFD